MRLLCRKTGWRAVTCAVTLALLLALASAAGLPPLVSPTSRVAESATMAFNSPSFSTGATLTLSLKSLNVPLLPRHYIIFEVPEGTTGASSAVCNGNGIPFLTTFPNRNGEEITHIRVEPTLASSHAVGTDLTITCSPLIVPVTAAEEGLSFRVDAFEMILRSGTMMVPFSSTRYSGQATVTLMGATTSSTGTSVRWRVTAFAQPLAPGSAFFFQLPEGFAIADGSRCTVSAAGVTPSEPVFIGALGAAGSAGETLPWYGLTLPEDGSYTMQGPPIDTLTCTNIQFPSYATNSTTPTRIVQLYKFRGRHITVADDVAVFPSVLARELSTTRVSLSHPYAHASSTITVSFADIPGGYKSGDYIALTLAPSAESDAVIADLGQHLIFQNPAQVLCSINGVPGATGVYANATLAVNYPGDIPALGKEANIELTCAGAHLGPARPQLISSAAVFSEAGIKSTSNSVIVPAVEPTPSLFAEATLVASLSPNTGLATTTLSLGPFPTAIGAGDRLLIGLPAGWHHYSKQVTATDVCQTIVESANGKDKQTAPGVTTFTLNDGTGSASTATAAGSTLEEFAASVAGKQFTLQHVIQSGTLRGSSASTLRVVCSNMLAPPVTDSLKVTAVIGTSVYAKPIFFSQNVVVTRVQPAPTGPASVTDPNAGILTGDFAVMTVFVPGIVRHLGAAEVVAITDATAGALGLRSNASESVKPRVVQERVITHKDAAKRGVEATIVVPVRDDTGVSALSSPTTAVAALQGARDDASAAIAKALKAASSGFNGKITAGDAAHVHVPATCGNGEKDMGEVDTDCGGDCFPCRLGKNCGEADDCATSVCGTENVCVPFTGMPNSAPAAGGAAMAWAAAAATAAIALATTAV